MPRFFFSPTFVLFILLFTFLIAPSADAENIFDEYLQGSYLFVDMSEDSITDTTKFETELFLNYKTEDLKVFTRLSNDRPFPFQTDKFEIQKRGFEWNMDDDWKLSGGDYSLVFGRGLALMLSEDRGVDRDTQLDGAKLQGDIGDVSVTGFWGQHKTDNFGYHVTGVNTNPESDPDSLYGGRITLGFDDVDLGASWLKAKQAPNLSIVSTTVTEFDIQWIIDDFTLYYETAFFNADQEETDIPEGRGQVAEINWSNPGVSIGGTWVKYKDAYFDYATAPSLKRTEVDESNADARDSTGYKLDGSFSPDSWNGHKIKVTYVNLAGIEAEGHGHRDIYLEWASPSTQDYSWILSYERLGGQLLYYGGLAGVDENFRFSIDGPFHFGGNFHASARYRTLSNSFEQDDEVGLGFDWSVSPEFTIGFFRETSTRPVEPPPPGMIGLPIESPGHWNMMFVNYSPDPWSEFELLIGSRRGGYQCSGGVCANLPPFKGIQFTYYRLL